MSEKHQRKINAKFVRKPPAEDRALVDEQALTRKNVLWSATLELMDNRSVDCVITSISTTEATIYLSQFANCRGQILLRSPKIGKFFADVIDQDGKQIAVLLHASAKSTIAKILTTMS